MRRTAPRSLEHALDQVKRDAAPATLLARVQGVWETAVGEVLAEQCEPVSERDGRLDVTCTSSLWASELELSARDVLASLNEAVGGAGSAPLTKLRAKVGKTG